METQIRARGRRFVSAVPGFNVCVRLVLTGEMVPVEG